MLIRSKAMVDKLVGDEVAAFCVRGLAGPGEILVSEDSWTAAGLQDKTIEQKTLQLKGRTEPLSVRILRVAPP